MFTATVRTSDIARFPTGYHRYPLVVDLRRQTWTSEWIQEHCRTDAGLFSARHVENVRSRSGFCSSTSCSSQSSSAELSHPSVCSSVVSLWTSNERGTSRSGHRTQRSMVTDCRWAYRTSIATINQGLCSSWQQRSSTSIGHADDHDPLLFVDLVETIGPDCSENNAGDRISQNRRAEWNDYQSCAGETLSM